MPELIAEVLAAGGAVLVSDHRGETVRLPAARRWPVADGSLSPRRRRRRTETLAVVEVAVPAARVAGTVARLRAEGHQVLRVRSDASTAASQARPAEPLRPAGAARPAEPSLPVAGELTAEQPEAADAGGRAGSGGGPVSALVRMRLAGFLRTGRAVAPLLAGLIMLGTLYGGGRAQPAEAYGVSAVVLFPVLAWQTKMLLDVEPDVQRRLAQVTVGVAPGAVGRAARRRGGGAGDGGRSRCSFRGWSAGCPARSTRGTGRFRSGSRSGVWAHLLVVPAAVALGALASRASVGGAGYGVAVLALGGVGAVVLGLTGSVAPWLAPPIMAAARTTGGDAAALTLLGLTGVGAGLERRGRRRLPVAAAGPGLTAAGAGGAAHRARFGAGGRGA